ncbi:hypothetical protein H8959_008160 [Pygathrix nigripes]
MSPSLPLPHPATCGPQVHRPVTLHPTIHLLKSHHLTVPKEECLLAIEIIVAFVFLLQWKCVRAGAARLNPAQKKGSSHSLSKAGEPAQQEACRVWTCITLCSTSVFSRSVVAICFTLCKEVLSSGPWQIATPAPRLKHPTYRSYLSLPLKLVETAKFYYDKLIDLAVESERSGSSAGIRIIHIGRSNYV